MIKNGYISAYGVSYTGALSKIRKSHDQLQPIYEAFTNSLEALKLLDNDGLHNGFIILKLCYQKDLLGMPTFESIVIEDNGIGFNEREFERLITLDDASKGFFNKGSGRVQFLHFFEKTEFISVFGDTNSRTGFKQRKFTLSKGDAFLKNNAILKHEDISEIKVSQPSTSLHFRNPLNESDLIFYKNLTIEELKENLINRYLELFCENREHLPKIGIQMVIDSEVVDKSEIKSDDIPSFDQQNDIKINYCRLSSDGKSVEKTNEFETLNLKGFKINKQQLKKNGLKLTSKGEIAKELKLESLLADDHIEGNRYLFLLSGDYINRKDTDIRGNLNIPTLDEFKKNATDTVSLFDEQEIIMDDIREIANETIIKMYSEISLRQDEKRKEIEKLKEMFLLDTESIKEAKIKLNDTEEEILEKIYKAEAKTIAKKDAEIKRRVDALDTLNPASADFGEKLLEEINGLTRAIPLQNRTQLTHYIARRKLILNLFDKILEEKLEVQKVGRKNTEALIHSLLFQKGSDNPRDSSLWIINEDFIYFMGNSEIQLSKLHIGGEKVFKEKFSEEEERYLSSLGENRKIKRPDVLLFPDEGKCIIIEFKAPDVNASDHLTQINSYASLIRNYTVDRFQITTFYGYLIGESIEPKDVMGKVSGYEYAYELDYLFSPSEKVHGFDGRANGSIYKEVIKYSTLLARSRRRNEIFIEQLTKAD